MFSPAAEAIIKETSKDTYDLLSFLRKEKTLSSMIPVQLPVVSLVNGTIKVYKNFQFDPREVKRSIKLGKTVFKPTLNFLQRNSYITVKSLEVVQYIKYTTFLNTYLRLKYSFLKDSEIRDLANKLSNTLHRGSTKFILCKTLQDYSDLYIKVHAFSCMTPKPKYDSRLKTYLREEYGLWPSMWYYYNPYTQGVYLKVRDRLVARAILIRHKPREKFTRYYDDIYAESGFYRDLLKDMLEDRGFSVCYGTQIDTVFKVPAIKVLEKPVCPLPFSDCIDYEYSCFYNKKENAFYFGPNNKLPAGSIEIGSYDFSGYIDSELRPAHRHLSVRSVAHAR